MAGATGLEPATSGVTGRRSNQLSYAPVPPGARTGRCTARPPGKSSNAPQLAKRPSLGTQSRFVAKALPDADLRYLSNANVCFSSENAMYVLIFQGANFDVCDTPHTRAENGSDANIVALGHGETFQDVDVGHGHSSACRAVARGDMARLRPSCFGAAAFTHIASEGWWAMTDSNRRHPRCKRGALPTELIAPAAISAGSH